MRVGPGLAAALVALGVLLPVGPALTVTVERTVEASVPGVADVSVSVSASVTVAGVSDPHRMETVLQDDALFLHRTEAEIQATLQILTDLGVDRLRVTAGWSVIAPDPTSKVRPNFDATNPNAYPAGAWNNLDKAVKQASQARMPLVLDIAFWAPLWATDDPAGSARGVTRINPVEYGYFAEAVAKRYAGAFFPTGQLVPLPRVSMFTIWNEPNHGGFLQPQWNGTTPESPNLYRPMLHEGYEAVKRVRADPTVVLVGGTSSTGGSRPGVGAVPPLRFLRELACVDANLTPLATPGCAGFEPLPGDGWAHHPYSLRQEPWLPSNQTTKPDDAMLGDLPKLVALLHELVDAERVSPGFLDLWLTEYGFETDDPVWNKPWTAEEQAKLIAQSEYLAWQLPEVRSYAQFLLRDINTQGALDYLAQGKTGRAPGSWQIGLYFEPGFYNGDAKPAASTFPLHFLPMSQDDVDIVKFWGNVRPATGPALVAIERSVAGSPWERIESYNDDELAGGGSRQFASDPAGFFIRYAEAVPDAEYRLLWVDPVRPLEGPAQAVAVEHLFDV